MAFQASIGGEPGRLAPYPLYGERAPMHEVATRTISLLRSLEPDLDIRLEQQESFCAIHLPAAPQAEYRFVLYVHDDGEPQVCATLVDGDPDAYFWHWPFEEPDFDTQSEREEAFLTAVHELLTSPTRIRQKRGLLSTHFRCEVQRASGWARAGPFMAGLKGGTKPPADQDEGCVLHVPGPCRAVETPV